MNIKLKSTSLQSFKKKIGWDSWQNWHPRTQALVKLFPFVLIVLAIPLTVSFLQQTQNLFQYASKNCHGNNPYCNTNLSPTPIAYNSPTPTLTPIPNSTSSTPTPTSTLNSSSTYYVSPTGTDTNTGSQSFPWQTLQKAANTAPSNATIIISSGTYSPFSITRPYLTFQADSGASPIVSGGATAITIKNTHDIIIKGLKITNASSQGVWVDTGSNILFSNCHFDSNIGHGIQIIRSSKVEVSDSTASSNKMGGIRELNYTTNGVYVKNIINNNGHDGQQYNGDGILLQGSGALVSSNTISNNGDSNIYEHGIYASALASGYTISNNTLMDNAASGIKADGAGTVSTNTISGSVRGIVFSGTGGSVTINSNIISATLYSILVTSGADINRYQSDYNTYHTNLFGNQGNAYNLLGWQNATGLDKNSLIQ